ncbi:hypothetical protein [Gloeothece verrucosa]|uniref:Uncharacterized protein n=1 Tax=Gloeothece verrucosa (strain PCC 7822) TaxID=497965 RepID=E0UN84_GLOV7|nr:hypothetical protein [Gloeothece verrucosa]ADN18414.1 hypothetical protein Cyan7822_6738 [Gloeothece verrucosa PCC 7822]
MKPYQQPSSNLPLGRKLKKKLPVKVIRPFGQLLEENQKLSLQLERERPLKTCHSNPLLISQLQAENSRLKNELSSLFWGKLNPYQ